ncbi:hypothetical protein LCGC14_1906580 [marine sediment metagenome]|uniref:Uncharacterized protein n=1 Tax=marine sediment metagenome TaxID=412755 RepID=A0A0F9FVD9_9ZZZZ
MKCERCGLDIAKEHLKFSRGYCEKCGSAVVEELIKDYIVASEEDRRRFRDAVVAEMLTRSIF